MEGGNRATTKTSHKALLRKVGCFIIDCILLSCPGFGLLLLKGLQHGR